MRYATRKPEIQGFARQPKLKIDAPEAALKRYCVRWLQEPTSRAILWLDAPDSALCAQSQRVANLEGEATSTRF
jgi:hypothetical protein